MVRAAVVQFDPQLAEPDRNVATIEATIAQLGTEGVNLAVFPECAVTGYVYGSLDEALGVAEPIPGARSDRLAAAADRHGVYAVVGTLERAGDRCFNSAILVGPGGLLATYRKTHTLCLGVDRFTTPGDIPYQVHDLPFGRIGILICYDLRFPEPARVLALQGAQAILLPTNWPETSFIQADVFTRSRAAENRIFILAANRIGEERDARFLGRSQMVAPDGNVIVEASRREPATLIRELDLDLADTKNVVLRPGEHEYDAFADRRPDLYGLLQREVATSEVR